MGSRNLDRIDFDCFAVHAETAGDMLRLGWRIQSVCLVCGLKMDEPLENIVKLAGPDYVLWDKKGRCRRVGCHGARVFEGRPRGMNHFNRLTRPQPLPDGRP